MPGEELDEEVPRHDEHDDRVEPEAHRAGDQGRDPPGMADTRCADAQFERRAALGADGLWDTPQGVVAGGAVGALVREKLNDRVGGVGLHRGHYAPNRVSVRETCETYDPPNRRQCTSRG